MNRDYLLDSLDGLKAVVFRLLPDEIVGSIACVPMTTDGPWTDAKKAVFCDHDRDSRRADVLDPQEVS